MRAPPQPRATDHPLPLTAWSPGTRPRPCPATRHPAACGRNRGAAPPSTPIGVRRSSPVSVPVPQTGGRGEAAPAGSSGAAPTFHHGTEETRWRTAGRVPRASTRLRGRWRKKPVVAPIRRETRRRRLWRRDDRVSNVRPPSGCALLVAPRRAGPHHSPVTRGNGSADPHDIAADHTTRGHPPWTSSTASAQR